jgi:hypothetical protein
MDHGTRFAARAASASLLGLVSLVVFVVSFAYASRRWNWLGSLAASWTATVLADIVLAQLAVGAAWAFIVVLVAVWVAHRLMARLDSGPGRAGPAVTPWWDLPGRAAATAVLVLAVTGISATVGPVVTGILAPFPIATSVVAAFALAQQGSPAAVRTLAGVMRGLVGFAVFCLLLAVLLVPYGVPGAFAVAVAGTLVVQLLWTAWSARRRGRPIEAGTQRALVDRPQH